jgi:peptidyl-prolyl cis-trans isomerase D
MAKTRQPKPGAQPQTKLQMARSQRVRRRERNVTIGVTIVAVLVIGILGFGALQETVIKPNRPIAKVNGVNIPTSWYQKLVRLNRDRVHSSVSVYEQQKASLDANNPDQQATIGYLDQLISQSNQSLINVQFDVLNQVIDDEMVRQEAKRQGIVATAAEIDTEIEQGFGYQRNPPTPTPIPTATSTPITPTLTPTVTPTLPPSSEPITPTETPSPTWTPYPTATPVSLDSFQTSYKSQLEYLSKTYSISEGQFRRMVEVQVLRTKLQAIMETQVAPTGLQIHAAHILVATQEEATKVKERLDAGEDFAALAAELSTDTSNKDTGGDLGWFSKGSMVAAFDNVAFEMQPGQISDPVQTDYGWHIIKLIEADPNHTLDEASLAQKKSSALTDWLTAQRNSSAVKWYWNSESVPADTSTSSSNTTNPYGLPIQ